MSLLLRFTKFLVDLPSHIFTWKFLFKSLISIPLICVLLFLLLWFYLSTESISNLFSFEEAQKYTYDYVIVGGGTAGCILASRLSENAETSVLLIESGSTFSPLSMVPFLTSQQQRTRNDWNLQTVTQKYSSLGFRDQIQYLPRGKGLGGSSQLNYLLHFDGTKKDLRRWQAHGAELWDFDDTPHDIYTKNDCNEDSCSIDGADQAKGAEMPETTLLRTFLRTTSISYDYSLLSSTFVDGSDELRRNHTSSLEYNLAKYNTDKGLRHSSYHAYLKPAFSRSNLKIVLSTRVHRVLFNKKTAVGVLATEDYFRSAPQKIYAAKEVILAAGAFHTPQILKLSGIGPVRELKRFDIKLVHNSPMVGRNLYDHMSMPIYVSVDEKMSITRDKVLNVKEMLKYLFSGHGIFGNFGVIGYLRDTDNDHGTGIFGVGSIDEAFLGKVSNTEKETFRANFPFYNDTKKEGFVLLNACYQPLSRGTVRLQSNRIHDAPDIDPNYLENSNDVECLMRAIRLAMDLMATDAFKAVNAKIQWPQFTQCKNFITYTSDDEINVTDRYLECIIRVGALTAHHPGGSCAIGKSPNSALDSQMRVRGVRRLRVVDASIIPTPVSGHPHTAIAAMAEWASRLILRDTI